MCGSIIVTECQNEQQCYKALNELYDRHGSLKFKYVTCSPKTEYKEQSHE